MSGDCLIGELERVIEKEKPKENLVPEDNIVFTLPKIYMRYSKTKTMNQSMIFATTGWNKKDYSCSTNLKDSFSNYLRYFLDNIDAETVDKFDFFTNKNVKYLFYKFNDYLLFNGQNTVPLRHSKIAKKWNCHERGAEQKLAVSWYSLITTVI